MVIGTWIALLLGVLLGVGAGLTYSWAINPVVSVDVQPWQLNRTGQDNWIIALSVAWARDGDLLQAANRLNDLRLNEGTFPRVATLACDLARSGYAQSNEGLIAIRSMVKLAESQGYKSCAADLILLNSPTPAPTVTAQRATPTLPPPFTKTPTPEPGPTFSPPAILAQPPTAAGLSAKFLLARTEPFCSAKTSGVIEVLVQEPNGTTGIAGMAVLVEWSSGQDRFFTGLKPERGTGFADFRMESNGIYTVELPGSSERSTPLVAQPCTDRGTGGSAITSWRLYFRRGR
jgi:hypothetical protein